MNERKHWDKIAPSYNDEIFDVFNSDRDGKLGQYFSKHSNKKHRAIDFGCGTGKAFPFLSPNFKRVLAIDISEQCLAEARNRPFGNIDFKRMDLAAKNIRLPAADFMFCCNVIMLPEPEKNEIMFKNFQRCLRKGGSGLIVVPSAESILYSTWRMIDWYKKEGVTPAKIPANELDYFNGKKMDMLQGIFKIDGVATKHYSESELEVLFARAGLMITSLEKLNYDWNTEFSSPPKWMKDPYPWDWLIECKKPID
ncbi:MAG: class I SAM-dependent methyltransferase [Chryseolinea sp.]